MDTESYDKQEKILAQIINETGLREDNTLEVDVEDTTCKMVEYLDFSSDESEEEHYNTLRPKRGLEHQFSVKPADIQANRTADLSELFDYTFQKNENKVDNEKKEESQSENRMDTTEFEGSNIFNINQLLEKHNLAPVCTAKDIMLRLFEVLVDLDDLKHPSPAQNSTLLDRENIEIFSNSRINPKKPAKTHKPSLCTQEVQRQLSDIMKINEPEENSVVKALHDVTKDRDKVLAKYRSAKQKFKELDELREQNTKCLQYIWEIEKDKAELIDYAQTLESRVEYYKKFSPASPMTKKPALDIDQFRYKRQHMEDKLSYVKNTSREVFKDVTNKYRTAEN
ncbi:unnamed protein product [Moneuplotes crassus]|uniref:Uncharacterized protein n=1 Tax=Euplotes crassus TaxID=5936 RepID=A0AAD1XFC3_EUPCR|nr:unnamed protein product [Moneuplotes crassus]